MKAVCSSFTGSFESAIHTFLHLSFSLFFIFIDRVPNTINSFVSSGRLGFLNHAPSKREYYSSQGISQTLVSEVSYRGLIWSKLPSIVLSSQLAFICLNGGGTGRQKLPSTPNRRLAVER
jgi:hypothetical protein